MEKKFLHYTLNVTRNNSRQVNLRNKRILITAGPTWVPIDKVRVISNIATGETGILLAQKLRALGAQVTLLLGPVETCCLNSKIKIIRFRFFDELKNKLIRELKNKKYDIVIHSAAVSDYRPAKIYRTKIKSGLKNLKLNLIPTTKIIDLIRKMDRFLFLVGFKLGSGIKKDVLIEKTRELIQRTNLDLAVANTIDKNRYYAYIVELKRSFGPLFNKKDTADTLIKFMGEKYGKDKNTRGD